MQTEDLFDEVDFSETDMIVLPGGMPGTTNLKEHEGLKKVLLRFAEEEKYIGAICAAPTVLDEIGILQGKRATCYPGVESQIKDAILTRTPVMRDGNIITGQGVGTAIDFALKLVEVLAGEEKAKEIAEAIVY